MIQLPKNRQKRNQLLLTVAGTVVVVAVLGLGLVRPQYAKLAEIKKHINDTESHLKNTESLIRQSNAASNELSQVTAQVAEAETDMATGDIYAWSVDNIRHFKSNYRVDVPEIGQPSMSEVDLFTSFPYKQLRFSIHGNGYYHDIGRFIADLEDKFPHMRVVNLEITPVGPGSEKLAFSMDIIALVKSSS
ncbi:MAG TPA: hypothetical protein VMH87_16210 [Pseudomonadales bacterium]|nr:hypothetical protein [Pseudomonadales bacterium]